MAYYFRMWKSGTSCREGLRDIRRMLGNFDSAFRMGAIEETALTKTLMVAETKVKQDGFIKRELPQRRRREAASGRFTGAGLEGSTSLMAGGWLALALMRQQFRYDLRMWTWAAVVLVRERSQPVTNIGKLHRVGGDAWHHIRCVLLRDCLETERSPS